MSTADPVTSPSSTNTWINGLKWGAHWDSPGTGPAVITYALQGSGTLDFGGDPVTATDPFPEETAALAAVLASIENIINVDFVLTTDPTAADIVYASVSDLDAGGNLGVATPPGEYFNTAIGDWQGSVIINWEAYAVDGGGNPTALNAGGFDYITWLHETGHALGLAHPHDNGGTSTIFPGVTAEFDDYGDFNMNQGIYTTMTYNDGWLAGTGAHGISTSADFGYQMGLMALDIAALQLMYGANTSYHTGNDSYFIDSTNGIGTGYLCIWDAGGIDTIVGTGTQNVRIDLRAATLGLDANGGGYVSSVVSGPTIYAGFTIAAGVVIENATGGTGADTLIGNSANNILNGLGGADDMEGLGGNDTYYTDNVLDSVTEALNAGTDIVRSTVNWTLGANLERLYLLNSVVSGTGNTLANYIFGNNAANTINGGAGDDRLYGYDGNDTFIVDSAGDRAYEVSATGGIDSVRSSLNWTLSAEIEKLYLTGTAANGTGNGLANSIYGNNSANTINGGAGSDRMYGEGGNDTFIVDSTGDQVYESSATGGTDTVRASASHVLSVNVENLTLNGTAAINATGNAGVNTIIGNAANNILDGKDGSDAMTGGRGQDQFQFSTALGASNVDAIADFNVLDDTIRLENAIFTGLAAGTLAATAFVTGASAADGADRIIYNSATGALLFDSDGTGAAAAQQFAILASGLALTAADFFVF